MPKTFTSRIRKLQGFQMCGTHFWPNYLLIMVLQKCVLLHKIPYLAKIYKKNILLVDIAKLWNLNFELNFSTNFAF